MATSNTLSRGDQTRDALIRAALRVFGSSGFDAASTRAIAREADVNQALIGYHFGGKRGLYLGVFEYILAQMQLHMAPVAQEVAESLAGVSGDDSERHSLAVELLLRILDAFNEMVVLHAPEGWVRVILREQQDPGEAFDLLYDNMLSRMMALVTRLVAMGSGLEENSEACRMRALMLFGQVLIFHTARGTAMRHMGWDGLTEDKLDALKKQARLLLELQFSAGVPSS